MTKEELKSLFDLTDNLETLAHNIEQLLSAMRTAYACAQAEEKARSVKNDFPL